MFGLHLGLGRSVATRLGLMYPNWTRQHYLGLNLQFSPNDKALD